MLAVRHWCTPFHKIKEMHQALPPGWISQFDSKYQRNFYVNTATGQTQWEVPSLNSGTLPHNYGQQNQHFQFSNSNSNSLDRIPSSQTTLQSHSLHTQKQPLASSLPSGFIAQTDPATGKVFYVNTATGASQWEMPVVHHNHSIPPAFSSHQPPYATAHQSPYTTAHQPAVYHSSTTAAAASANSFVPGPESVPSQHAYQPYPSTQHAYQPYPSTQQAALVSQMQPSNLQNSYISTLPPSSLNKPVLPQRPSISSLSDQGLNNSTVKVETAAVAGTLLQPLPPGYIAAQDPASGKTFYVNTETGKSQWNDPREQTVESSKPQIPPRSRPHEESKGSLNQGQPETPRISVTEEVNGASAPYVDGVSNDGQELLPSAPIENLLDDLTLAPVLAAAGDEFPTGHAKSDVNLSAPSLPRRKSSLSSMHSKSQSGLEPPILIPERSLSLGRGDFFLHSIC